MPPSAAPAPLQESRARRWRSFVIVGTLLVAIAAVYLTATRWAVSPGAGTAGPPAESMPPANAAPPPVARFMGAQACASCHADAQAKWRGSQHAAAMLEANAQSVRGAFNGTKFAYGGVTTVFTMRDGRYFVRTDGPDGTLGDFEVKYTFGVEPLQQYLIEMPGGRLQALGVAWDSRPRAAGGQRWFHLYPDRKLKAGDPLHWTGIDQNWNYQCADCHSTDLRKNYDEKTASFETAWSEVNVGCESCHGPGSNHVAWAQKEGGWQQFAGTKGLTAALDERHGVTWTIDAATGNAARSQPRTSDREVEVCARCHARRGQFSDDHVAGQPLHDAFRPALLDRGLYYPDGQQRDEVYKYGSFLQSRMHAKGVTCSDCHDPHTQALRAPGNAVCAQCHAPARYDAPAHHRHAAGSPGTACASCHMPTTVYMGVDARHDHSMRIPRPDRSVAMGVPNACSQCHRDRPAQWAADAVKGWFPQPKPGFQGFAEAFDAADRGAPGAQAALLAVVTDMGQSAIARASALSRLARYLAPETLAPVASALNDVDPNVRMAAVQALGAADPASRLRLLPRMLVDPVRVVRMDAARTLAGETEQRLGAADLAAFNRALAEYVAAQEFNADRPEAQAALGTLDLARGNYEDAIAALRTALKLDPAYPQAAVNLADLYRVRGLEKEAESVLRDALKANPASAAVNQALGLTLIRQQRVAEALAALGEAARLAPQEARYAYVHAVALHDTGKAAEALRVLTRALEQDPYNRDVLLALGTYEREAGRVDAARSRAKLLRELEPTSPQWARAAAALE
ncbi:MAG: tetratricopeptide repeat protein [Rubrivivax sp.]|nr:tetratricopeptide repeat protein [Rubrivivax sp.]